MIGYFLEAHLIEHGYVSQRWPAKDCVIATLATVTRHSYEEIAHALDIAIDEKTRLPELTPYPMGIDILSIPFPLLRLGWSAAVIVTEEGFKRGGVDRHGPTSEELKPLLIGQRAILGYTDPDPLVGDHSLAWDGTIATDCSNGGEVLLSNIVLLNAIFLTPLSST
ncbi:hypothetical protein ACQR10_05430 [Bradyrhizobium sp. HKCCYLRH2060]|uniref:hypothetical protein n=1 Tax=Bradyrhizobium TaxID=374 RepID=UPI0029167A25|nr:hypothetical protein [Bradyrhizobium sp. SZCCHNR3003]